MDNKFPKVSNFFPKHHVDLELINLTPEKLHEIRNHQFMMTHGVSCPVLYSMQLDGVGYITEKLLINGEWFGYEGIPDKYALGRTIGKSGYEINAIRRVEDLSESTFQHLDLLKRLL